MSEPTQSNANLNPIIEIGSFTLIDGTHANPKAKRINHEAPTQQVKHRDDTSSTDCGTINDNTNVFSISDFLSAEECKKIIADATPFLKPLDKLYAQSTRMADRTMIRSPLVANQLYKRLLPHLHKSDYAYRTPLCFGHDGVWVPLGLNECLKVFRYEYGGLFIRHRDGPWVPRQDQCSMYTVIVYLNDEFEGGETTYSGANSPPQYAPHAGRRASTSSRDITPVTGTALIMNHDCWHGGQPVYDGEKWILRTELIFQRVHSFYVDKNAFASDELYNEARRLYDSSMAASAAGDREAFFDQYQQVVQLQRDAMLREEGCRKERALARLNLDELSQVLSFLTGSEIGTLLTINRKTYMSVAQAPFWQLRWKQEISKERPLAARFAEGEVTQKKAAAASQSDRQTSEPAALSSLYSNKTLLGADGPNNTAATLFEDENSPHADYFGRVRQTIWLRIKFSPAGLLLSETGVKGIIRYPLLPSYEPSYEDKPKAYYGYSPRPSFSIPGFAGERKVTLDEADVTIAMRRGFSVGGCKAFCGRWQYLQPFHMNLPESIDMGFAESESDEEEVRDPKPIIDEVTGAVEWSVLSVPIGATFEVMNAPLVVITHPAWHAHGSEHLRTMMHEALDALLHLARVPAAAFCHPAVCAAVGFMAAYSDNCPVYTNSDHARGDFLSIELIYNFDRWRHSKDSTASVSHYYLVNTRTFEVSELPEAQRSAPALRLIDFRPRVRKGNPKTGSHDTASATSTSGPALLPALVASRANAPKGTAVYPLSEVIGHGTMTIIACPTFTRTLMYRY